MAYLNRDEFDVKFSPETVYGYIYLWENKINGKRYVGQTVNLDQREESHIYQNTNTIFHKAIIKYGEENFDRYILDVGYSREELDEKEVKWISELDTYKNGYNSTIGGKGVQVETRNHHRFSGKYFQLNDIFGEFLGCYEGECGVVKAMVKFSDNTLTIEQCRGAVQRNTFPYKNFLLTPIDVNDFILYKETNIIPIEMNKRTIEENIINVYESISLNSNNSLYNSTYIFVSEFKKKLTEKELNVFEMLEEGYVQEEIVQKLNISQSTICRIIKKIRSLYSEYLAS